MRNTKLPDELHAEWIWLGESRRKQENYVFFRKEFTLDETPGSAELWITARTLMHVYVNERHLTFGPPPSPLPNQVYVACFDVSFLLSTGMNFIAALVHNTAVSRFSACRQESGFWAQLNVSGKPLLWTNQSWNCLAPGGYGENRPRRAVTAGFTEKMDFHFFPTGWNSSTCNTNRWRHPDVHATIKEDGTTLMPLSIPEFTVKDQPFCAIANRGVAVPASAATHISFQSLLRTNTTGVYTAEAFIYSEQDLPDLDFLLFSDNPYKFFANGACVKEQGIVPLTVGGEIAAAGPLALRQGDTVPPEGKMNLLRGWNKLLVGTQLDAGNPGFTLVFPSIDPRGIQFIRSPEEEETVGWSLAGPLRTPLANLTSHLRLHGIAKMPFNPSLVSHLDEGAWLASYQFVPGSREMQPVEVPAELELAPGEFAVLDLGSTHYGCPSFSVQGNDNDCIDVICGERMVDGFLPPYQQGRQNVDSLVLGAERYRWMGCAPRGLRYMLIFVRKARTNVKFSDINVQRRDYALENSGVFKTSDDLLNQIWETGRRTLSVTLQDTFMDSPCKENAQYIPDCMLQSWAAYHISGNFDFSAKSLNEFAMAQVETGEMPAVCPSDNYVNIPDYSLLWPVWLHRHYMYAGDDALLEKLFPNLEDLMSFFHHVSDPERGFLFDLDTRIAAPCFIDHGNLDRKGIVTGLNAIYCRALLSAAWLAEQTNRQELADKYRQRASLVAHHVRALTWNPEFNLFADSWHDGVRSNFYSWQMNLLAIYGGLVKPDQYGEMFDRIFKPDGSLQEVFAISTSENPYFKYFVLETAVAIGRRQWALNTIRRYWGGMVARGAATWWEFFNPLEGDHPEGSLCHGYGVTPNGFLCTELAGVRPAQPGFRSIYFSPLIEDVEWVEAEIPTPHGRIMVAWKRAGSGELDVTIAANYPLEVIPILDPAKLANATFNVSDEITVLAPPETPVVTDEDAGHPHTPEVAGVSL